MDFKENTFMQTFNTIVDLVLLSILWTLCSLPVITIGASTAALYRTLVVTIRQERGTMLRSFLTTFGSSFRQSVFIMLLSTMFMAAFGFGIYFCYMNPIGYMTYFYGVFSLICLLVVILAQLHAYTLIGRFKLSVRELVSLIVRLTAGSLWRNLLLLLLVLASAGIVVWIPPVVLFVPSGAMLVVSLIQEPVFKKHIRYEEE